jgi:hypothetical protein
LPPRFERFDKPGVLPGFAELKSYHDSLPPEHKALRSLVMNSEPPIKYNPLLQAVIWAEIDNIAPQAESIIYSYKDVKSILNNIWGECNPRDPRWSDYRTVLDRLNRPSCVAYFMVKRFKYTLTGNFIMPSDYMFKNGDGDCKSFTQFAWDCLKPLGYNVSVLEVDCCSTRDHILLIYRYKGYIFTVDGVGGSHNGPFNNVQEINQSYHKTGGVEEMSMQMFRNKLNSMR